MDTKIKNNRKIMRLGVIADIFDGVSDILEIISDIAGIIGN